MSTIVRPFLLFPSPVQIKNTGNENGTWFVVRYAFPACVRPSMVVQCFCGRLALLARPGTFPEPYPAIQVSSGCASRDSRKALVCKDLTVFSEEALDLPPLRRIARVETVLVRFRVDRSRLFPNHLFRE